MAALLTKTIDPKKLALRSLEKLPPFSPVLQRLLARLLNPDIMISELADLVEKDAVLTSYVLRLVNSASMMRAGDVTSVAHAIALMGLVKLRNALISFSVCQLWSRLHTPVLWSGARFNLHSVATALAADLLAQEVPVQFPEGAFVAGMLHDLGKLLIAISFPVEWEEIRVRYCGSQLSWVECEREVLHVDHAELSAMALERWNLPIAVRDAVGRHHANFPGSVRNEPEIPLGYVISVADQFVCSRGLGLCARTDQEEVELPPFDLGAYLPIGKKSLAKIETSFDAGIEELGGFFGK